MTTKKGGRAEKEGPRRGTVRKKQTKVPAGRPCNSLSAASGLRSTRNHLRGRISRELKERLPKKSAREFDKVGPIGVLKDVAVFFDEGCEGIKLTLYSIEVRCAELVLRSQINGRRKRRARLREGDEQFASPFL